MEPKKQWTIAGIITTAAILVGWLTALDPWPKVGWKTPNGHQEDITMLEGNIERQIKSNKDTIQILRDDWQCTRWRDELTKLYDQSNGGDNSRRLADQIARQRVKMDNRMCDRFGWY